MLKLIFLYKLVPGVAESSFGTHVANLAGVPLDVVKRAEVVSNDFKKHFSERLTEKRKRMKIGGKLPMTALADFAWLVKVGASNGGHLEDRERANVAEIINKMKSVVLGYTQHGNQGVQSGA